MATRWWACSQRSDRHSLTVRGDLAINTSDPTEIGDPVGAGRRDTRAAWWSGVSRLRGLGGAYQGIAELLVHDESTAHLSSRRRVGEELSRWTMVRSHRRCRFGGNSASSDSINSAWNPNEIALFSPSRPSHRCDAHSAAVRTGCTPSLGTYTYNSLKDFETTTVAVHPHTVADDPGWIYHNMALTQRCVEHGQPANDPRAGWSGHVRGPHAKKRSSCFWGPPIIHRKRLHAATRFSWTSQRRTALGPARIPPPR